MSTYSLAGAEVDEVVDAMMKRYHAPLVDAGVTVTTLFAFAKQDSEGNITGHAIKHHGWPARAVVRITSQKQRAAGANDVEIVVDGDAWPQWPDDERDSTIDHELEHVELQIGDNGNIKTDDCRRPKLKMREHDWEVAGFESVARRHRQSSIEVKQVQAMRDRFGNLLFGFAADLGKAV